MRRLRRLARHIYYGFFVTSPRVQFHVLHRHDDRGRCL